MKTAAARTMFEIYRDAGAAREYRVIYFTELESHERDGEIERAMEGEHVFDGYIAAGSQPAREGIQALLERLNRGEALSPAAIERELSGHLA